MKILIHSTDKTFMVLPEAGSIVYDRARFELVELADNTALEAYIIEHELVLPQGIDGQIELEPPYIDP